MFCRVDQYPSDMLCLAQYFGAIANFNVWLVKEGKNEKLELETIK